MAFGALSVKGRALRYLAQREHSRHELERKLARHVEDTASSSAQAQIAAALDQLEAAGLLSETRAAESVLRCQGQRFGSRRLKQVLLSKGLDAELVSATLKKARVTETQRARDIWQRRFGHAPVGVEAQDTGPGADRGTDPAKDRAKTHAKQMRFLAGRGFDAEVIRRVVLQRDDD
jgi:regulatory protein